MAITFPTTIDGFTNPAGTQTLNDPAVVHHIQHSNHNDAIVALETKLGVNLSSVATSIDFITNFLVMTQMEHPSGGYREVLPSSSPFPSIISWYTNSGKTVKLLEKTYLRDSQQNPTTIELKLYDGTIANSVIRTITDSIVYSGPFELSRTRTIT